MSSACHIGIKAGKIKGLCQRKTQCLQSKGSSISILPSELTSACLGADRLVIETKGLIELFAANIKNGPKTNGSNGPQKLLQLVGTKTKINRTYRTS